MLINLKFTKMRASDWVKKKRVLMDYDISSRKYVWVCNLADFQFIDNLRACHSKFCFKEI